MSLPNNYFTLPCLCLGLCLNFWLISSESTQANSPSTSLKKQQMTLKDLSISVTFNPPDEDEPDYTVGGASRDGLGVCLTADDANTAENSLNYFQEFLPLTPVNNNYGLTVSERPTFYAYIPENNAQQIFFSLRDEAEQTVYQTELSVKNTGGIVSFTLPETAPQLEIGKYYQWSMVLMCNQTMRPDSPQITAWVKRIEPLGIFLNQNENQVGIEMAALYAKHGIWYDSLNLLANLWRQSAQTGADYPRQWGEFLSQDSVGLEAIANQPLLTESLLAEHE